MTLKILEVTRLSGILHDYLHDLYRAWVIIMIALCGGRCGERAILNTNKVESLPLRHPTLKWGKSS